MKEEKRKKKKTQNWRLNQKKKKKKKKPEQTEPMKKEKKKKEKKKNWTANPEKKGKKNVKSGQKVRLVLFVSPSCVFNYKNAIELWVMETENIFWLFSVSITHNSKIRELSDGNRVMETELSFAKQPFCYGSHHFWVISYGNRELSYENWLSKQPLNLQRVFGWYHTSTLCKVFFVSVSQVLSRAREQRTTH